MRFQCNYEVRLSGRARERELSISERRRIEDAEDVTQSRLISGCTLYHGNVSLFIKQRRYTEKTGEEGKGAEEEEEHTLESHLRISIFAVFAEARHIMM